MIRISRIALVAIGVAGIAAPAFAQSFDPDVGTGNIVPFSVGPAIVASTMHPATVAVHRARRHAIATRQSGFNAFAMVPRGDGGGAFNPAATGGGSVGYNENLRRDQW